MKRLISLFLSIILIMSVSAPLSAYAEKNIDTYSFSVTYKQDDARSMLKYVNDFRLSDETWYWQNYKKTYIADYVKGVPEFEAMVNTPLIYDYELEKLAMQRAAELAIEFDHSRPMGEMCFSIDEQGRYRSENIHMEPKMFYENYGVNGIFTAFKEDIEEPIQSGFGPQGHRITMMGPYKTFACAICYYNGYYYCVQSFGVELFNEENTPTTAINAKKKVTIPVLLKQSYALEENGEPTYNIEMYEKETVVSPVLVTNSKYGTIINKSEPLPFTMVGNNQNATFANGKITGNKAGTTVFTVKSDSLPTSENIRLNVTVKHKYKRIKYIKATTKKKGKKVYKCTCCGLEKTTELPKLPPTPTNFKLKSTKKNFIASWKKQKNVDFFDIEVKTKDFKMSTGLKASKTKYKQKNLKSGKIYKVRIRAVRYVNGKSVNSKWTKWKKVKIK